LDELVKEYKNPQNGLVCGLTNPVNPTDFNQQKKLNNGKPFTFGVRYSRGSKDPLMDNISLKIKKKL